MRTGWVPLLVVCLVLAGSWSAAGPATCPLGVPSIRLGVQGAASGPHADYGRQIEMGAQRAIE
jgi:hypothetical protein